jgi:hypothetical protein
MLQSIDFQMQPQRTRGTRKGQFVAFSVQLETVFFSESKLQWFQCTEHQSTKERFETQEDQAQKPHFVFTAEDSAYISAILSSGSGGLAITCRKASRLVLQKKCAYYLWSNERWARPQRVP